MEYMERDLLTWSFENSMWTRVTVRLGTALMKLPACGCETEMKQTASRDGLWQRWTRQRRRTAGRLRAGRRVKDAVAAPSPLRGGRQEAFAGGHLRARQQWLNHAPVEAASLPLVHQRQRFGACRARDQANTRAGELRRRLWPGLS